MTTPTHRVSERAEISHDQAQEAALALIDHYFHNQTDRRVKVCIPRESSDTDAMLCDYIHQQRYIPSSVLIKLADEWEDCGSLASQLLDAPGFSVEIYTTTDGFLKARLDCEGAKALANCVISRLRAKAEEEMGR